MKYLSWLKIQKCYPYPLILKAWKKIMDFRKKKKKKREAIGLRAAGLKSEFNYTNHHSPQSNRFVVWHHTYFFSILFVTINFYHIFDPHCPVQVNGENFQDQNFAFLTSELKSALNFSLENIFYILVNFFFVFSHQMSAKPWLDLEPCRKWCNSSSTRIYYYFYVQILINIFSFKI